MKIKVLEKIICLLFFTVLLFPLVARAQNTYQPLSPLPGVTQEQLNSTDPGGFFNQLFIITLAIAAVVAVLALAVGGLQYMGTDAWSKKEDAKKTMYSAVGGLLILLFSVLLLRTINPDLVSLQFFDSIRQEIRDHVDPRAGPPDPNFAT